VADTKLDLSDAMSLSSKYATNFFGPIFLTVLALIGIALGLSIVGGILSFLSAVVVTVMSGVSSVVFQFFSILAAAVLYIEIKKRYVADEK